jgi:hypothetical protein
MSVALWLLVAAGILLVIGVLLWPLKRKMPRKPSLIQVKQRFHAQRERLEAKFVQLAARANPHAPRWADVMFDDDVAYVRSRTSGELSALVSVSIAIEGSQGVGTDGTGLASERGTGSASGTPVGNLQAGTAVFRFDRDHWETDGRTLLNLSPGEAIRRLGDLEIVSEDFAHRR